MQEQINGRELVARYWQEQMQKHPRVFAILNIIKGCIEFFGAGHVVPWLLYKTLIFSSRVADGVLIAAALWITALNVAPSFMTSLVGGADSASSLSSMALLAFSLLPELITVAALVITIKHWLAFLKRRERTNVAWIWGTLYAIPTLTFLGMTIYTIVSFVSKDGGLAQITGLALVIRCLAAWGYSFVEILYFELGRQAIIEADEKAKLRQENDALQTASTELRQRCDALTLQVDALSATIQQQSDASNAPAPDALTQRLDAPPPKRDAPRRTSSDAQKSAERQTQDAPGNIVDMRQASSLHTKIHQLLDKDASLSGYELAKLAGCSEPTARRVKTRYLKTRENASGDAQTDVSAV